LEAVFVCREGARLFISNALPFLLAHRSDALDPGFADYHARLFRILHGIGESPIRIPSRKSPEIRIYYYHKLAIGSDLEVKVVTKPEAPRFQSYEQYRDYLIAIVRAALANAADSARPVAYHPISTASQGYDSPTATAISHAAGNTEVLTQGLARRAFKVVDSDSGEEIAKALGMQVTVFDRLDYLKRTHLQSPEAEFICLGLEGLDVNFLTFEPHLAHRVLFTGCQGDTVWDKYKIPNTVIHRGDLTGASLGEFRRRVDFFHIPVPFIGVLRHPEIHAIANSPALAPFTLNNDYDRPVPRRICEEAGIPREAFGMAKKAVAMMFFGWQIGLDEKLAESSRRSLGSFAATWHPPLETRLRLLLNAAVSRGVDLTRLVLKKSRLAERLHLEKPVEHLMAWLDENTLDTPETVRALHWAMAEVSARYRAPSDAAVPQNPARGG
jgi:hypothetical protein